jgi:hypothetical protein
MGCRSAAAATAATAAAIRHHSLTLRLLTTHARPHACMHSPLQVSICNRFKETAVDTTRNGNLAAHPQERDELIKMLENHVVRKQAGVRVSELSESVSRCVSETISR